MRLCVVHDDVNLDDVVWMLQTRLQTSWSAWANQAIDQVEEASVNQQISKCPRTQTQLSMLTISTMTAMSAIQVPRKWSRSESNVMIMG